MPKSYWLILGAVLIIILVFLGMRMSAGNPNSNSTPQTSAQPQTYKMSVQNSQISPALPLAVNTKVGETVNFDINVDRDGQVHFHNGQNEVHQDVRTGDNKFSETFNQAGNWAMEFHPAINNPQSSSSAIEIDDSKPGINLGDILVSP